MLTRSSQIGEFYVMSPPQVEPADGKFTCDLLIYDEESDRHVRIQWADALGACLYDQASAQGKNLAGSNGMSFAQWHTLATNWSNFNKGGMSAENFVNNTKPDAALDAKLDLDLRIVVARPFIEHLMVRRSPLVARLRV